MYAAEMSYHDALKSARSAIRAGDLGLAERWMKLAERQLRAAALARKLEDERISFRRVWRERERARLEGGG